MINVWDLQRIARHAPQFQQCVRLYRALLEALFQAPITFCAAEQPVAVLSAVARNEFVEQRHRHELRQRHLAK